MVLLLRLLAVFFVVLVFVQPANAVEQLQIEKIADPKTVESGGTVRILLNMSNPFDEDILFKIRDKNSVGGTTIDTQCIQGKIVANAHGISEYESLQVQNPGVYTLGAIEIKYTNPDTGKEEVIVGRNKVDVTVTGGNPNFQFSSSSTKVECQFDEEQQQQQEQQQQEEQKEEQEKIEEMMKQQQQQMQDKLSQSRQGTNQDMSSVKSQQQKEAQEAQERLDEELDEKLADNDDFLEMQKDLEDRGYQEKSRSRSPLRDNETEFKYDYEKSDGEKGEITGKMKDGEITDLRKFSDDDRRELEQSLSEDKEFSDADKKLKDEGFVPDKTEFSGLDSDNSTSFKQSYKRDDGETASIEGDIKDGDVSDVGMSSSVLDRKVMDALENNTEFKKLDNELQSLEFGQDGIDIKPFRDNLSSFSLQYSDGNETVNVTGSVRIEGDEVEVGDLKLDDGRTVFDKLKMPLLLLLILFGVYTYIRYVNRDVAVISDGVVPVYVKPINPRKEAMKLIGKALKLYDSGKKKEAYTMVSSGVRLYFKYVICSEKDELTTGEIIRYVRAKEKKSYVDELRECFTLCDLVKFAKYKPNDEDFKRVVELARKCVR